VTVQIVCSSAAHCGVKAQTASGRGRMARNALTPSRGEPDYPRQPLIACSAFISRRR
jgi:hypothetical protein